MTNSAHTRPSREPNERAAPALRRNPSNCAALCPPRRARFQSSGWMCTNQPSWSTNQTETGLVELSIQDSRSIAKGSGRV